MAHARMNTTELENDIKTVIKCKDRIEEDLQFVEHIDRPTKEWINALVHQWELWKRCEHLSHALCSYFSTAPNPYLSALRIVVYILNYRHSKNGKPPTLAITVIEEFSKWVEPRREDYIDCLDVNLKIAAFKLISKQTHKPLIVMVSKVYEFMEHKEEFLRLMEKMIQDKAYKDAATYITMLQLQEFFPNPEKILFSLLLQNKHAIVDEYLTAYPQIQNNFVHYLDQLITSRTHLEEELTKFSQENNIPHVKGCILNMRSMSKMIARLMKLFDVPHEYCPNLSYRRSRGGLNFLISRRYEDGTLGLDSWRELLPDAVGNNRTLHLELIRVLARKGDAKEGLYWAKQFNIPEDQWPWSVICAAKQEREEASSAIEEGFGNSDNITDNYHKLCLPKHCIKVIDNAQAFEKFVQNGLNDVSIVGFDCEWKPSFGNMQNTPLALVQIATASNVYILDVATMGSDCQDLWDRFVLKLFGNTKILKLGYGIAYDMTTLRDHLPALSKIQHTGEGYLDIEFLSSTLIHHKFVFPYTANSANNKGLSKLVEHCFGQGLNKSDQCSNWLQRPLRESQITYAALDAYCLLEIYNVMEAQCKRLDIPFYDICTKIQNIPQKTPKKKKPLKGNSSPQSLKQSAPANTVHRPGVTLPSTTNNANSNYNNQRDDSSTSNEAHNNSDFHQDYLECAEMQIQSGPIPAHQWRVVCDPQLGGLTSKLRLCGCDCVHVMYDESGDHSARLAMTENRVLLTRNEEYLKFLQYLQPDKCYRVKANTPDDQLKEVLEYFGVVVTQKDIFSRCRRCNCDEFVQVPNSLMCDIIKRVTNRTLPYPMEHDVYGCGYQTNKSLKVCDKQDMDLDDCGYDRTWCLSTNSINLANFTTKYHVRIQIDKVPLNVLRNVRQFYICERCGKVYWHGSYLKRTLNSVIRDLIVEV